MPGDRFTHLDGQGRAQMVDVTDKAETQREATARARIRMKPQTLAMIRDQRHPKGDVIATARIAGIQAAKKTWDLIPMCHLKSVFSLPFVSGLAVTGWQCPPRIQWIRWRSWWHGWRQTRHWPRPWRPHHAVWWRSTRCWVRKTPQFPPAMLWRYSRR